jgi:hypothetical protein
MTGGGPWPPGHMSRRLSGRWASGIRLRAVGGLVGDRGGAQGQRRPSLQAWALAARLGLVGGGLATRATDHGGGGCMVAVAIPGGTAIPRARTRHRGVRGRCGGARNQGGEGSEGRECDGGELSSDVHRGGVLR